MVRRFSAWYGRVCIVALALAGFASPALAWNPIILPNGAVVTQTLSAAQENQELIAAGSATPSTLPFANGTTVYEIRTTRVAYFVRYYKYDPTNSARYRFGGAGRWMMAASSVKGLNSYQVRSLYALPAHPDRVIVVRMPAGTLSRTGNAGPITGWGAGGGQQFLLNNFIDVGNYQGDRSTTDLLYTGPLAERVGSGNARIMGQYLDGATVPNYSLLDVTELMLSYLPDDAQRRDALNQLGPQRFDALSRLATRQDILFSQALSQRRNDLRTCLLNPGGEAAATHQKINDTYIWGRLAGALGEAKTNGDDYGFNYHSGGVLGGADWLLGPNLILGFGAGFIQTEFDWKDVSGKGAVSGLKMGVYTSYFTPRFFLDGVLTAGYNLEEANRDITFPGMDYSPHSNPDGYGLSAGVDAGMNFLVGGWTLQPLAGLNFYYVYNNAFSETGADSLDLSVDSFTASTLRGELALRLSRSFTLDNGTRLVPQFRLGWAHQFSLGDGDITARLADQDHGATFQGYDQDSDAVVPGVGLTLVCTNGTQVYLRYDGELGGDMTSNEVQAGIRIPF
ncbi:MAG: autotransporter outer membrane beta-barrel domain-containing protein [Desulfarculaceae bacterium]|nr:autotransporter outer membrane beta-barrel domain-containing protein [Desulfarculaceae bacterium]